MGEFYFLAKLKGSLENYSFVRVFFSKENSKEYFPSDEVLTFRETLRGLGYEIQISNVPLEGKVHKTLDIILKED